MSARISSRFPSSRGSDSRPLVGARGAPKLRSSLTRWEMGSWADSPCRRAYILYVRNDAIPSTDNSRKSHREGRRHTANSRVNVRPSALRRPLVSAQPQEPNWIIWIMKSQTRRSGRHTDWNISSLPIRHDPCYKAVSEFGNRAWHAAAISKLAAT